MKRILLCLAMVAMLVSPVGAENREQWAYDMQPPSNVLDQAMKDPYVGMGQLVLDMFGGSTTPQFRNICVTPDTGLYIQAGPCTTNTLASLYQASVTDYTSFGAGGPYATLASPVPADPNVIVHQGLASAQSAAMGPLTSPTGSNSVIDLVEAQVNINDRNSRTTNFVSASNVASSAGYNLTRADDIAYQVKQGTPASSPTAPTLDSGWVLVATLTIPASTTTITTGMIAGATQFGGFQLAGSSSNFIDTTTNAQAITATKIWNGAQTYNGGIKFGGSSVATGFASTPGLSGDGQTHAGIIANLGDSSSLGLRFLTNGSLNGASITQAGAFMSASNTYLSPSLLEVLGSTFDGNTLLGASGNPLTLNSAGSVVVRVHYNDGTTNPNLLVYDGTTSNYALLSTGAGLAFSASGSNVYGPSNVKLTGLTAGRCLQLDGSSNITVAAGACGVSSGTLTSITGTYNTGAAVSSGAVTLSDNENPLWTGVPVIGSASNVGTLDFGTDGNYNIGRSGSSFVINGTNSSLKVNSNLTAGSSVYGSTFEQVLGSSQINYNTGSAAGGVKSYDGGTSNYALVNDTGLSFSNSGGSSFGLTNTNITGTLGVAGASTLTGATTVGGTLGVTGFANFNGGMASTTGLFSSVINAPTIQAASGGLSLNAASGANQVAMNYGTSATGGLSVYNGSSGYGPIQAATFTAESGGSGFTSYSGVGMYLPNVYNYAIEAGTTDTPTLLIGRTDVTSDGITAAEYGWFNSAHNLVQGVDLSGNVGFSGGVNSAGAVTATGTATGSSLYASAAAGTGIIAWHGACSGYTQMGGSGGAVAGVTAQAFYVYSPSCGQYLSLDDSGNLGVSGNFFAASRRELKTKITKLTFDPLSVIDHTNVLEWCYKKDLACLAGKTQKNIGPMANDAPIQLTNGKSRQALNLDNEASTSVAAIKELHAEVIKLEITVSTLQASHRDQLSAVPAPHMNLLQRIHYVVFGD